MSTPDFALRLPLIKCTVFHARPRVREQETSGVRWWPLYLALGFPVADVAIHRLSGNAGLLTDLLLGPLWLGTAGVLSLFAVVLCFRSLIRRAWSQAVITVILPLVTGFVAFHVPFCVRANNLVGDVITLRSGV
jgi:hypothetical protein